MTLFPYTFPWLSLFYLFNLSWPKCGGYETLQLNDSWLISSPRKLTGIAHIFHHRYSIFNSFYAVHLCCGGSKLRRDIQMSFSSHIFQLPSRRSLGVPGPDGICIPSSIQYCGEMGLPQGRLLVGHVWNNLTRRLPGCLLIRFQNHIKSVLSRTVALQPSSGYHYAKCQT